MGGKVLQNNSTLPYEVEKQGLVDGEEDKVNAMTGNNTLFYQRIRRSIARAEKIDIIVSFLMESCVKILVKDLKVAVMRGARIRISTGNYLNITQPQALYLLRGELGNNIEL